MAEVHTSRVHTQDVVLDIGGSTGALIIYTDATRCGEEIELSPAGDSAGRTHMDVAERWCNGRTVFAAVYPALSSGPYTIWGSPAAPAGRVHIRGGQVTELDWRR